MTRNSKHLVTKFGKRLRTAMGKWWRASRWHKALVVLGCLLVLMVGGMYGIARWYIASEAHKPFVLGTSFIADYASSLGLDPHQTLSALLDDLQVKHLRYVSYWSDIERTPGQYDFSELDWEFQQAEAAHATVSLSIGLRQPRWPECHLPDWAQNEPAVQWQPQLEQFMTAVVQRYQHSPALQSYQVENEFFLKGFGVCEQIPGALDRSRLVSEFNLVKRLDPSHIVIINRSNNALGWPVGEPQPDEFGISIYKRVWDGNITHRYLEYPFPAWYYAFVAGWQKIFTGRDMIIHEMQAESWAPAGGQLQNLPLDEANKSLDAKRLAGRVTFAKGTGMREVYLWGSEYWYYRKTVLHDPSLWNVAKQEFTKLNH